MRTHPINCRQAESAVAPQQEFATPQDEIRHIKATDRTISGFARILEIVRDSDFFSINQGNGHVHKDWLTDHSTQCNACVGALLAWFYGTQLNDDDYYYFSNGRAALAGRLGFNTDPLIAAVNQARRKVAGPGKRGYRYAAPFNSCRWAVDYADVFHELARMFPGK